MGWQSPCPSLPPSPCPQVYSTPRLSMAALCSQPALTWVKKGASVLRVSLLPPLLLPSLVLTAASVRDDEEEEEEKEEGGGCSSGSISTGKGHAVMAVGTEAFSSEPVPSFPFMPLPQLPA